MFCVGTIGNTRVVWNILYIPNQLYFLVRKLNISKLICFMRATGANVSSFRTRLQSKSFPCLGVIEKKMKIADRWEKDLFSCVFRTCFLVYLRTSSVGLYIKLCLFFWAACRPGLFSEWAITTYISRWGHCVLILFWLLTQCMCKPNQIV